MVRDLDLVKGFENLYVKPVYLYGAGYFGKKVLKILDEIDISVEGFVDRNLDLIGNKENGIEIYALDEIINDTNRSEFIIIVTTVNFREEIVNFLEKNGIRDNVYTIFGLFSGIYFNLNSKYINEKVKEKYREKFLIWIHNKGVETYFRQVHLDIIDSLLYDEKNPILIYQPGKVGSNTVEATLKGYNIPVVRCHGLLFSCEYCGNLNLRKVLTKKIKSKDKIKMITLIRDPIAKDIGHFFQKITEEEDDAGWYVKGIMEEDFQTSFLNFLSIISPFDFTENKDKQRFAGRIVSHIDYIGAKSNKGAFWGWYEEELKKNLGIDILECNFDKEIGYGIMNCGNVELLILKLEKLNNLEKILGEFVGIGDIKLVSTNQAETKSYKYAYRQFCKEVKLPRRYIEFCYEENEYFEHFYSDTERNCFYKKWLENIVDI